MAGGKFIRLADIDHHALFTVDQLHRIGGRKRAAGAALDQGSEQHCAGNQRQQN
ncbi:hypothetical protein D3C78_1576120 [compost metagenome]